MKKIYFLFIACLVTVITFGQDGIVYWSPSEGYSFDFNLDGIIELTLPTQTQVDVISNVFVSDFNKDGYFDLCEVSTAGMYIMWYFYKNDGNNNFEYDREVLYGISGDKVLSGDFNGDGIGDVAIRRDNEYGLWWLISFAGQAPDVNLQFGINNQDILLAGDLNNDGQDDIVCYNSGSWLSSFTPSTTQYKTPDFATKNIDNMIFGTINYRPFLGDFDGDGYADMALCSLSERNILINYHDANKPENNGYSIYGYGTIDETIQMPLFINPTQIWSVPRYKVLPNSIKERQDESIRVFPTILKEKSNIYIKVRENHAQVYLYNALGQQLKSLSGNNMLIINTENISTGSYLLNIIIKNKVISQKIIIY